jgi:serpin B
MGSACFAQGGAAMTQGGSDTKFALSMLKDLTKSKPSENVFFSPFSVSQALDMALNGAAGSTQSAIESTLNVTGTGHAAINDRSKALLADFNDPKSGVELSVANALWASQTFTFNPTFQAVSKDDYNADTQSLDFMGPSAAATINAWVKNQTKGKIDEIVSARDLMRSDAVLTNAIYFHGAWTEPFEKSATQSGPFKLGDGSMKTMPMMDETKSLSYFETPNFQAVRLPYGPGRLAFYVFLPTSGSNLDSVVSEATPQNWASWTAQMKPHQVHLKLPRFKANTSLLLNDPLTDLGMGIAFTRNADFSKMGQPPSFISKVLHKAIIEVNEEGTVAAAATGITMSPMMAMRVPVIVNMTVDHPFLCAIRDDHTGTILFIGAIRNPEEL